MSREHRGIPPETPLLGTSTQDQSTVFKTTLDYYQRKLPTPDSQDPAIALTAKEWYGFHNYNSLRAGFFGGDTTPLDTLFTKKKSPLDIICSWLLIRHPDYLQNIAATQGNPELLLTNTAPAPASQPSEGKEEDGASTTQLLSLFQIFNQIQDEMDKELQDILENLADKLTTVEEIKQQNNDPTNPQEQKPQWRSKFSLVKPNPGPGTQTKPRDLVRQYIKGQSSLEDLQRSGFFDFDKDGELKGLHFLDHAKELYARRKEDSNASLKVLKKAINAYTREQELATGHKFPKLTKRGNYDPQNPSSSNRKSPQYSITQAPALDEKGEVNRNEEKITYEEIKDQKRHDKEKLAARGRIRGWLYPILRCGAAVFGTCNVVSTIWDIPLFPTNPAQIALMLSVALLIGLSTFYSNFGLGLASVKTLKSTAKKLLWEPNPDPKEKFQWQRFLGRLAKSSLIVGTTAGVIAVYAVPLFNGIHKLATGALKHPGLDTGLTGSGLYIVDALGIAATLMMAWFVVEIFLPRISDFVHKCFKQDGSLTRFLKQELTAHKTGEDLTQRTKLFFNHTLPNFLRLGLVGACIGGSCYVIWGGLNSAIIDSFSLIPGFSNGSGLTMASYALVAISFIGAFIFTYESMFASAKTVMRSSYANSSVDDLIQELDQAALFQVNKEASLTNRQGQGQGPQSYPIRVDDTYTKWAGRGDFILRIGAAAGSNFGTVGADVSVESATGGVAGTGVSFFNKLVGSKKTGLDRSGKNELPQSTYSISAPLIAPSPGIPTTLAPENNSRTPLPNSESESESRSGSRSRSKSSQSEADPERNSSPTPPPMVN